MKHFNDLSEQQKGDAVENQFQTGLNLATQGDLGGTAAFLGRRVTDPIVGEISETIRLAKLEGADVMEAIYRQHGEALSRAALERAQRAYYREPGDLVVGIDDRVGARRPGSTGRVKIRVLEAHEGGSDSSDPRDKVSGVFIDDQRLVARVACVSKDPELWAGLDLEGNRITPAALFKPMAIQRQKAAVRGWLLTHFNERAEAGEFDETEG